MLRRSRKICTASKKNQILDQKFTDDIPVDVKRQCHKPLGGRERKDEAEVVLDALVLGDGEDIVERLDETFASSKSIYAEEEPQRKKPKNHGPTEKKPAWEDEDDDQVRVDVSKQRRFEAVRVLGEKVVKGSTYRNRLKKHFENVLGNPSWAQPEAAVDKSSDDDASDSEDLFSSTGNYLTKSVSLPKNILDFKKCTDANHDHPSQGKLKSVQFHPTAQVLLTAGVSQTLSLFQVDGKNNPKIQSVFLEKFPIYTARFTPDGNEVIMGSKHKSFYYYDMLAGKVVNIPQIKGLGENSLKRFELSPDGAYIVFMGRYGYMHLLSTKSKEWIDSLKMNGEVSDIAFSQDGTTMYSHGDEGEVYIWDLNRRTCTHRFVDDGCIKGTCIDVSKNGQYLATGSWSGVVNVYDRQTCLSSKAPSPLRSVMNLTTPCSEVKFNPNTEILAAASNQMEHAVKLIHFPSMTVFSNFPDKSEGIRIPRCMDFSLHSGYLAVGNHKGQALLYRLKHYGNY